MTPNQTTVPEDDADEVVVKEVETSATTSYDLAVASAQEHNELSDGEHLIQQFERLLIEAPQAANYLTQTPPTFPANVGQSQPRIKYVPNPQWDPNGAAPSSNQSSGHKPLR